MTEVFQEKEDWGRILDELRNAGMTIYKVSLMLGRDWDTVNGWRKHEPKHCDGVALLKIHAFYVIKAKALSE
jgi:hypothetical protein